MSEESSFTVKDRRTVFQETNAEKSERSETAEAKKATQAEDPASKLAEATVQHVSVNFSSFILSLGTSALIHLGQEADPASGKTSVDLPNARQVIDLLTLLEEKTRGNLTPEEKNLVQQLLYTLRMKFISLEQDHHV